MSDYGPSTRDIAKIAGVSKTTVSLSLRNHPKISPATRERIQEIARRLGYRVDPQVSKFMSHIQRKRDEKGVYSLAVLIPGYASKEDASLNLSLMGFIENVEVRARMHGYNLDFFFLGERGLSDTKLLRILRTRAVEGVIIGPTGTTEPALDLDLSQFPVAMCTLPYRSPAYHRVEPDYYHDTLTVLAELYELGYRRLAIACMGGYAENATHHVESAYYYFSKTHSDLQYVQPYLSQDYDCKKLDGWLRKHQPDCVISNFAGVSSWLVEIGYKIPEDIGFCMIHCTPSNLEADLGFYPVHQISGVLVPTAELDGSVVDMVVDQIHRHERGMPTLQKTMVIQGDWVARQSVSKQRSSL